MGYTTDFEGIVSAQKPFSPAMNDFLTKLNETRRMKRNQDPIYGVEGEFFVDGEGYAGQGNMPDIIDHNSQPRTQPGLWCQWQPVDGDSLQWDGGEKFYCYVEWLTYIIRQILAPNGYVMNGEIQWRGEDFSDTGTITVKDNVVSATGYDDEDCNTPSSIGAVLLEDGPVLNPKQTATLPVVEKVTAVQVTKSQLSPALNTVLMLGLQFKDVTDNEEFIVSIGVATEEYEQDQDATPLNEEEQEQLVDLQRQCDEVDAGYVMIING